MATDTNLTSSQSEPPISTEVWNFLRENGVRTVIQKGDHFKFLTKESNLIDPGPFFGQLKQPLIKRKKENGGKFYGFRRRVNFVLSGFEPARKEPVYGPEDAQLDRELWTQLKRIHSYSLKWGNLAERICFGVEIIPADLRLESKSLDSSEPEMPFLQHIASAREKVQRFTNGANTAGIQNRLKLSRRDSSELNESIVEVVEHLIDKRHSQEEAFSLASEGSSEYFKKWLKLAGVSKLSPRTIEGRYKRNKDKLIN